MTPYRHVPLHVLVVGGGVAGLETCFALEALAGERVHVTLIAPNRYLSHRPAGVHDPLAVHGRIRVPLARLAHAAAAELRHDRVTSIELASRRVYTAGGYELPYDALVIAVGAAPEPVPARAHSLRDGQVLMRRLYRGRLGSLAFVEPPAPTDAFDLYDLAIEAATVLRRLRMEAELTLVTAQPAPLAFLGVRAAGVLSSTLGAHGVRVAESAYVQAVRRGGLELAPRARRVAAEGVIAAPRLTGPRLPHLPCDRDGFLPVDVHGRVTGAPGMFAAGDCTPFAVRHPSLAAQQADAAAAAIAADAGSPAPAEPFMPVLRGMLPSRLRWYVEAPLIGGQGDATRISATALWSPNLRFHARFLAPHLEPEAVRDPRPEVSVA
jgi:sulfide:quinone oxidoreductase